LISIDTVPALPDDVFDVSFTDGEPNSTVAVEDEPDVVANADEASQPQPVVTATDIAIEAGVSGELAPPSLEGAEPDVHQVSAAGDTSSTEAEVPLTEGAVAVSGDPVQEPPAEVEVPAEPDTTEIVAGLLVEAETHMDNWRLRKPAEDNAYLKYQQVLELEPENPQAREGMSRVAAIYAKMAERAIKEKEFGKARGFIDESRAVAADNAGLQKLEDKLMLAIAEQQELEALAAAAKKAEKIDNLLALARADEEAGRIRSPVGNNALEKYQQVLDLDPDNDLAIDKLIEYGR
jgi:hypothetical protein